MFYVNQFEHILMASWIVSWSSTPAVLDHFPGGEDMNLLFNSFEGSNEKKGWQQKNDVLE